jgi:hypothetical protein
LGVIGGGGEDGEKGMRRGRKSSWEGEQRIVQEKEGK